MFLQALGLILTAQTEMGRRPSIVKLRERRERQLLLEAHQ